MRKKVRKSLAFLLALALVVSVMSGLGLSVSADDAQNEPVVTETEGEPAEEKLKAEESTPKEGEEEEEADPDAEAVPEETKDVKQTTEGEGSGDAVKDTTADSNGQQKDEPQAEPAAEEPAEPEEEPAASYLSTLSVEELYAYLTKLDDNNFAAAWKELTDSQKAEYNAYVLKMAFGDNKTTTSYEGGAAAASMTNVAGLVSNLAASQKALRNSPARAARAAAAATTLNTAAQDPDDGLYMSKSITKTVNDTADIGYKIRLESYATGQTTTSTVTKSVPCDIVLVLDQSGSMAEEMDKVKYTDTAFSDNQTNAGVYEGYSNNLFVLVQDIEGNIKHVPITVERTITGTEYRAETKSNQNWRWNNTYSNYYYQEGEHYWKVTNVERDWYYGTYTYTYTRDDKTTNSFTSDGDRGNVTLYQKNDTYSYTYSYKEAGENAPASITIKGNNSTIPTKTNNPAFFEGTTDGKLYYSKSTPDGEEEKLTALKNAVRGFVASVKNDATQNNVDHNIAIVGFASHPGKQFVNDYWVNQNTEILTGVQIQDNDGVAYNTNKTNQAYTNAVKGALQDTTTDTGKASINAAVDALDASGATRTDYGVDMAKDIFATKTQSEPDRYGANKRNKVVVVFTDGTPTSLRDFDSTVATGAISNAKSLKGGGATVYTIGIFKDANANTGTTREDKFLHYVSSNHPNATSWEDHGNKVNDGYYLTAANSADLNSIFQKISQSISESSSKVKLTETTQTIDKMSAEFKLPDNIQKKDVKVYKVPCTSFDGNTPVFDDSKKTELDGATITFGEDTVSVSGFNYSEDYVNKDSTKEIKGYKLLIEFPVEYKNEAWFGGNDIASNDIGSGIYDDKGDCHGTFEVPKVNRAIDYEIAAKNQTIYVTNPANLQELLNYAEKDADKTYKPDGKNNKYVGIVYTLKDATGKEVGTYTIPAGKTAADGTWESATGQTWNPELEDCTTYTWTCTVTPNKSDGNSLGVAGTDHDAAEETKFDGNKAKQGTVHVLYPTVSARDEFIYWGETKDPDTLITVANDWTDQDNTHNTPNLIGKKPKITKKADFQAGEVSNTPSKDSDYNVIAKIGEKDITELLRNHSRIVPGRKAHESCDDTTGVTDTTTANDFRIHVKVKKLTVKKIVGGNMGDTSQKFKFTGGKIYNADKTEVTNYFELKNGESQTFKLKVGNDVSITEESVAGYKTSYKVVGNKDEVKSNRYNYGKVEATSSPDEVTVTYTNKKQINPPNGIITTIAPYAIMVVLAAGAGVYFVYSRRRHNG